MTKHPLPARTIWPLGKPLPHFTSDEEEANWWYSHEVEVDESEWKTLDELLTNDGYWAGLKSKER